MVNHGERGFDLSRIGASYRGFAGRVVPLRPVGRPPLGDRVHRRHAGDLEHPGLRGAAGAGRGQHRRAVRQRRHRQLPWATPPATGTTRTISTCAGCSSARSSRSCASTRTCRPEPAPAVGVRCRHQGRRRPVPAAARGTRALPLYARRPGPRHRAADDAGALPRLSRPGRRLHQPDRVPARPGRAGRPGHPARGKRRRPQVWFPPGTWEDYFTGATFTGPATATIDTPTSRMPVFVKAGGIIPLQPASGNAQTAGTAPITLQVHAGADGSFSMYDDAGTGLGYQSGQSAQTPISYTENASAATSTVTIGAASGSYPGEPGSRDYTVDLVDESQTDLRPGQRADARLLGLELQQLRQHAAGSGRRGRDRVKRDRHPDRRHAGAAGGTDHGADHVHLSGHRRGRPAGHGHRQRLRGDPGQQLPDLQRQRHELGRARRSGQLHHRQLER